MKFSKKATNMMIDSGRKDGIDAVEDWVDEEESSTANEEEPFTTPRRSLRCKLLLTTGTLVIVCLVGLAVYAWKLETQYKKDLTLVKDQSAEDSFTNNTGVVCLEELECKSGGRRAICVCDGEPYSNSGSTWHRVDEGPAPRGRHLAAGSRYMSTRQDMISSWGSTCRLYHHLRWENHGVFDYENLDQYEVYPPSGGKVQYNNGNSKGRGYITWPHSVSGSAYPADIKMTFSDISSTPPYARFSAEYVPLICTSYYSWGGEFDLYFKGESNADFAVAGNDGGAICGHAGYDPTGILSFPCVGSANLCSKVGSWFVCTIEFVPWRLSFFLNVVYKLH